MKTQEEPSHSKSGAYLAAHIIDEQTQRIYCERCESSGVVRNPVKVNEISVCPVCFGLGLHRVRYVSVKDVLCPTCSGMGRFEGATYDQAEVCERCGGRGLVTANQERLKIAAQRVPCSHCDGRGILRNPEVSSGYEACDVCFSLGSHLLRKMDGHEHICASCQGMGRLVDEESRQARWCKLCGGRGLVTDEPAAVSAH
jgi:DnaJ-class molecular chaperone